MNFETMVEKFNLGKPLGKVQTLSGGALHAMYKVETSKGVYAIKKLNPYITKKENFKKAYELSETIAECMRENKIPAVSSFILNDHHVMQFENEYFIIYPFVVGRLLDNENLTLGHSHHVGLLYALIHRTALKLSEVDTAHYDYFDNEHWITLIEKANHPSLSQLLNTIIHWNQAYSCIISELNKELVITHRDMHSQNILWGSDGQPHIIDWESAGLMNPMMEVIGYGLEWSGIILEQKINTTFFETLLTTYFENIKQRWNTTPRNAFLGWLGHCVLAWTEFNIRRMMGEVSTNDLEIEKGREIIEAKMIPCLNFIKENEHHLFSLFENIK